MRSDEDLALDFTDIASPLALNRREFLKISGGGIAIIFTAGESLAAAAEGRRGGGRGYPSDFNAYLVVGADGRVTCFTGKIEMGQGIITSLAQMLADELDVPLDTVDMVMGDTDLCPWDMGTFGSMTTRFFGPPLRAAAAEARGVLLELAADHFKVPKDRLAAKGGVVFDKAKPDDRVTYAQLTKGKKIERRLKDRPAVKDESEFTIIGKPVTRRDAVEKVTGRAKFAADIRLPGMLYARIVRPPAHDAKLTGVDTTEAEKMQGVRVIRDGGLIAVLHETPDGADEALSRVKAGHDAPASPLDEKTIFEHLLKNAPPGRTVAQGGSIEKGESLSSAVFDETYLNGYVAHAPMEPHAALAEFKGDRVTVWASTQGPFRARDEVASALDIPAENVRVITPFVGGGFGGKTRNQQAVEAARLAKLAGRPVQVAWTREEEFFYDTFRPAAVVKIRSGMAGTGKIVLWDYHVYLAGERGAPQFYDVEHHRTTAYGSGMGGGPDPHPFGTGAWRAPANNTNSFARESHIDIMAAKAGMDPVEFRRKNLTDARMRRVLDAAAEKFGWAPAKAPSGRGYGVACGTDSGTVQTTMVEVEVDATTGAVRVKRVVCAQEMGLIINPEGARIQMEGCITMGLGYALTEEIHFKGGRILDLNFGSYQIPRFSWLPKIETVLVEDRRAPAQGGGEPAIICMGGAIANAVFDATGARLRQLPLTPDRIKEAMAK